MLPKLYYDDLSAPCRAVLLTIKALNLLEIDLRKISLNQVKNLDPELLEVNPQHTVPTLIDGQLVLSESHAISGYLVAKYFPTSELYSGDPAERALIDQRLHFDSNILQPTLDSIIIPIIANEEKEVPKEKLDALKDAYKIIDTFILSAEKQFINGKTLTIADFSFVASISTASIILPVCSEIFPNLFKWYQRCKALNYYCEANSVGLNNIDVLIENKLRGRLN